MKCAAHRSDRRDFLRQAAAGVVGWPLLARVSAAEPAGKPARKPNIVLLLSDDHGRGDTGCYGNKVIKTPNIDSLGRQGLRFTHAFTATAMCTPSRSMLYTGLFPHRNGAHPNHSAARKGVKSIPHYLRPLGYEVALAGKRHVKPQSVFPFQYMKYGDVDGFLRRSRSRPFCLIIATHDPHAPYKTGSLYTPRDVPLPPTLLDTPETRRDFANYCHSVDALDKQVGKYLAMLDRHGLAKSTVFFYASDHGSGFPFHKWTLYDAGLNVPFLVRWPGRIQPGTVTGAMVSFVDVLPTLIELAGGTPPKTLDGRSFLGVLLGKKNEHRDRIYGAHTTQGIISGSFYPIRAVRTRTHKYIRNLNPDGVFTNILTEGRSGRRRKREKKAGRPKAGQPAADTRPLRKAAGPPPVWRSWLAQARQDPLAAERVRMYQRRPAEELYDLRSDPHELKNVAGDPANGELLGDLRKALRAWMAQQNDPGLKLWR